MLILTILADEEADEAAAQPEAFFEARRSVKGRLEVTDMSS
jgi:hypothetical protein